MFHGLSTCDFLCFILSSNFQSEMIFFDISHVKFHHNYVFNPIINKELRLHRILSLFPHNQVNKMAHPLP